MATNNTIAAKAPDEITGPLTAERYAQVREEWFDNNVELVDGSIVDLSSPHAHHSRIVDNVLASLGKWVVDQDRGVLEGGSGIRIASAPDTVRHPDLFFVAIDRLTESRVPEIWYEVPPALVVEVMRGQPRWIDVMLRVEDYQRFGVDEVWVIEPELRRLDILRTTSPSRSLTGDAEITSDALPGFTASLNDFFYRC